VFGAIAEFEKTSLVAKLQSGERSLAATDKCGGRKTYAEARPETVALARKLRQGPRDGEGQALRCDCCGGNALDRMAAVKTV